MRKVDKLILHCADTRTDQDFSVETISDWHKARGFKRTFAGQTYYIGYHYYIKLDGSLHEGRPVDCIGSHAKGQNSHSIGICFEGGKKPDGSTWDRPTDVQIKTGKGLINRLRDYYGELPLYGHYQFSDTKSCPNFDPCIIEDYNLI